MPAEWFIERLRTVRYSHDELQRELGPRHEPLRTWAELRKRMRRLPIDIGDHRTLHPPDDPPEPGDGWGIASHRCWLPGIYATEEAARLAFEFTDDVLRAIQDRVAPNCVTIADLCATEVRRLCPVHGLPLRPWHRVGKIECPDSACMYAEPHACEVAGTTCYCARSGPTVHGTKRLIPACPGCIIVKETQSEFCQAGDAQCTGRCYKP